MIVRSTPPRVIIASEFWAGASARGLLPGFRSLGWAVHEIDDRLFLPTPNTLADRLEARLRRPRRVRALNRAILRDAQTLRADVFLTVKGTAISPALLDKLRARGVLCVNYYPDVHFNEVPMAATTHYDLVATTKSFHMVPLERIMPAGSVFHVHHGYTDGVHRAFPSSEEERDTDILYVGNASPAKAALMICVAETLPTARIKLIGNGWKKAAAGTALAPSVAGYPLHGDFYAAEIARAKVVLAFHWSAEQNDAFADRVSTRTFEIPACGGFMLHIDNEEVRSLYDVPSEIDTFASPEELIAKVRYWLAHSQERQAVAARGHARAVPAYGYKARGGELAALIEARLNR